MYKGKNGLLQCLKDNNGHSTVSDLSRQCQVAEVTIQRYIRDLPKVRRDGEQVTLKGFRKTSATKKQTLESAVVPELKAPMYDNNELEAFLSVPRRVYDIEKVFGKGVIEHARSVSPEKIMKLIPLTGANMYMVHPNIPADADAVKINGSWLKRQSNNTWKCMTPSEESNYCYKLLEG